MTQVEFKVEPPVAYITFNDPDNLNAFRNEGRLLLSPLYCLFIISSVGYTDHDAFADALEEAERRPDVYVIGMSHITTISARHPNALAF